RFTDQSAYAQPSLNVDFGAQVDAEAAIFYWRISAVAGTTPIADCKLQMQDPTSGQFLDIDGAAFAQKTAAAIQALSVGPGLAADATGDVRSAQAHLPAKMRAVFTFDRTTADETYTFTLSVDWLDTGE
ncbi:MAG: hypothetical protein ACRDHO_07140, partial [Actinomycetota bacterium]